ncbi:MAG: TrpB-like pyridoxal-phosphate dependent enzyme, partial [Chloroflexi bacterium]|nr:TrpB-like pyridoxal-phosphate dependent enzyme [Chloroflexota bacterium]
MAKKPVKKKTPPAKRSTKKAATKKAATQRASAKMSAPSLVGKNGHKILLGEADLPKAWYNINADMPVPPNPVLHPGTKEPVTPDFLGVLFPMSLIMQEISPERWIEIPEPLRDVYRLWRPTPMYRARRLEKAL